MKKPLLLSMCVLGFQNMSCGNGELLIQCIKACYKGTHDEPFTLGNRANRLLGSMNEAFRSDIQAFGKGSLDTFGTTAAFIEDIAQKEAEKGLSLEYFNRIITKSAKIKRNIPLRLKEADKKAAVALYNAVRAVQKKYKKKKKKRVVQE